MEHPKNNRPAKPSRKRQLLTILAVLLAAIAIGAIFWSLQTRKVCQVPILMYHKIGDSHDSVWWVTAADFESHLQSLKEQGYRSILPSDLVAHRRWGKPLPSKPIIITFDDGYLNCLEQAEPLLEKYGFRGVCYLITGQISETPETRRQYEGAPILSWQEIRAMQKRGTVAFGGHTRNHANLRAQEDAYPEVRACFDDLRKIGGLKPAGFCYPFGQYHSKTPADVARAGFTTAVTCEDGIAKTGPGLKLMELPRVSVIGGTHRYHTESVSTNPATVEVRVWKEGHSMKVYPRLVWPGRTQSSDDGWLEHVLIADQPVTLTWPRPAPTPAGAPTLELWDDFRVLRLFQAAVPGMP